MNRAIKIETFAIFKYIDDSFLLLNDYLKTKGYQFIKVRLDILQDRFAQLIHYTKVAEPESYLDFGDFKIDNNFMELLRQSNLFELDFFNNKKYLMFLKYDKEYDLSIENNKVIPYFENTGDIQKFVNDFLLKLRLFKPGDIHVISLIDIGKDERHIYSKLGSVDIEPLGTAYSLNKSELSRLLLFLDKEFEFQDYTELAITNFQASLFIKDIRIRYISLITALECIFNTGKNQIAHTISRHSSLLISNNEEEFTSNYKLIKKLYNERNSIVHGGHPKKTLSESFKHLNKIVRVLIIKVLELKMTKEELFNYLNSKGY